MKQAVNYSIEENLAQWVKGLPNSSKFVNDLIAEAYKIKGNPMIELEMFEKESKERNIKFINMVDKINLILEEGNKQERVEAERVLKIVEEREQRDLKGVKDLTDTLIELGVFDDLMGCKDMIDINKVTNNLKQNKIENPHSSTRIFGMMELKRVVEAHKGHIKANPEKFAEYLAKLEQLPAIKPTQLEDEEIEE